MESIMQHEKECYICQATKPLHKHHIYRGTAYRKIADEQGCWVWLCYKHHNGSKQGVHYDSLLDKFLKRECQIKWQKKNNKKEVDFIGKFGKSYL